LSFLSDDFPVVLLDEGHRDNHGFEVATHSTVNAVVDGFGRGELRELSRCSLQALETVDELDAFKDTVREDQGFVIGNGVVRLDRNSFDVQEEVDEARVLFALSDKHEETHGASDLVPEEG
jgi:hypothetical protein